MLEDFRVVNLARGRTAITGIEERSLSTYFLSFVE